MHFHAKEMKHLIKTFLHKHFTSSPMLQTVLGRIFFVRTSTPNVGNLLDNYIIFDKSLFFGTTTQECKISDSPLECVCSEFKRNYPDNKEYLEKDGHICLRMRNHPDGKVSKLGKLGANYTPWLSNSELIKHMKANLNDFFEKLKKSLPFEYNEQKNTNFLSVSLLRILSHFCSRKDLKKPFLTVKEVHDA